MELQIRECKRCGHKWALRKSLYSGEPANCPSCGSARWNQPKIVRMSGKNG